MTDSLSRPNQLELSGQQDVPIAWRTSHLLAFAEVPLDPNPFMRSFEIQRLSYRGVEGCNVVIHRFDGTVEVNHEQRLGLERGWTSIDPAFAHMNVTIEEPADLSTATCRVDEHHNRIEATITDSTGADLEFRLRFSTTSESGPIFIPSPPCSDPTQMRFLTLNRFRLVDARTADLRIARNGAELSPQRLVRTMPKHKLSARSGGEILCASLCSPEIQTDTITSAIRTNHDLPQHISVRNDFGHFTLQLDPTTENGGSARVLSRLGQVASAKWAMPPTTSSPESNVAEFQLSDIEQDWRPAGLAPTKHALRAARRFRRRNESWKFSPSSEAASATSGWSN